MLKTLRYEDKDLIQYATPDKLEEHQHTPSPNCELITDIEHFYNKTQQWMLLDKN